MRYSVHRVTDRATILTSPIHTSFSYEARKSLADRVIVTRPREQRYFLGTERDQCASSPPAHSLYAIQDPIRGLRGDLEAAWLSGVHASFDVFHALISSAHSINDLTGTLLTLDL